MLEVLSAVTGESVAVFEHEELADASVKVLKQCLAKKLGIPRFRTTAPSRQLHLLDDDQTLIDLQVVQLVKAGVSAS